jgi:Uma2 family endonuclease
MIVMSAHLKDKLPSAPVPHPLTWDELCADPRFRDLPYKIELTAQGRIIMTPHRPVHSTYQARLAKLLEQYAPPGVVLPELAIQTAGGVRVADVAWMTRERHERMLTESAATLPPEICIEVASPGNSVAELEVKAKLYLDAGAKEVWFCRDGTMEFLPGQHSELAPGFPPQVELQP